MIIISHRLNSIELISKTPSYLGAEIDIRSIGDELIIHHDPFSKGESLKRWLKYYNHKFLILNVKEEGLEERLIEMMRLHKIENFFFLDQSFPFLIKVSSGGESRCAVRLSEYESINTVLSLKGKVNWVWVDYFTKLPIEAIGYKKLRNAGFKLCLVSPELQGYDSGLINEVKLELTKQGIKLDAVCTKFPALWE